MRSKTSTLSQLFILLALMLTSASCTAQDSSAADDAFAINIDLPSEEVKDVAVTIDIPQGLVYEPSSLAVSGPGSTPIETISSPNDGSAPVHVALSFGDVDNSEDQDIQVSLRAVVADVPENQNGDVISPIRASLSYQRQSGEADSFTDESDQVKIVEPGLDLTRSFAPTSAWRGDEVTCNLFIRHEVGSASDAFDVDVRESLPQGLTYVPGSMEILGGLEGAKDDSDPKSLHWGFSLVDRSWNADNRVLLRYKAKVDSQVQPGDLPKNHADLTWTSTSGENPEERSYSRSSEGGVALSQKQPDLKITLADNPDPVRPGGKLNYTISYLNRGGYALGAKIQTTYDQNLEFISADPAPDEGTQDAWTLGDLDRNDSATLKVTMLVKPDTSDGATLTSSAQISCLDGSTAQDSETTKVLATAPSLYITKNASDLLIRPGGNLNYTINYSNLGTEEATNVSVTDIVDKNLIFNPEDSTPRPSKVWEGDAGTYVYWSASTLKTDTFEPGDKGSIELNVSMPSTPEHPDFDRVYNQYRIDSDESEGEYGTLETFVVHSLYVRKKAEKDIYSAGEVINYTIVYGNELIVDADKAVVYDTLPDVEYLYSEPEPSAVNGNVLSWNIGSLPAKAEGQIRVYAKVKENVTEINYWDRGAVEGYGYVNLGRKLDTATKPDSLTNYANISAYYLGAPDSDSTSSTIRLADAIGTEALTKSHGSGQYSREDEILMKTRNKTIEIQSDLSARYGLSSSSLPQGRSLNFNSKWSEADFAKNRRTGASIEERYMYANRIDRNSSLFLDKNGSTLSSETSFEGMGHIGVLKMGSANGTVQDTSVYESQEDYAGSFKVLTRVDEYGNSLVSEKSVSGSGAIASDQRLGESQRSYQYGTGSYQSEEKTETATSYVSKDLNATYSPVGYSYSPGYSPGVQGIQATKWTSGLQSKSGDIAPKGENSSKPASYIGQEFSQADYLTENTIAKGQNEVNTEAQFSGRAEFEVQYKNRTANGTDREVSLVDEYLGRYQIARKVGISGVARYNAPHLSLSKTGQMDPAGGTFINYVITVVNDGNRALGPVYIWDYFPQGTQYVYSSLRPSKLDSNASEWTLTNLGIGETSRIELKLNVTEDSGLDGIVNRVKASGDYDGQSVSAENRSAIQLNWLSCCQSRLLASKTGYVSANDSRLVLFRIALKNPADSAVSVTIRDNLPDEMNFLSSSVPTSDYSSGTVTWSMIGLMPGETRVIDYLARALRDGAFVNAAHLEAVSEGGSDLGSADVQCQVVIGNQSYYSGGSEWQPPVCFGLNCTYGGTKEEWIPCDSCAYGEQDAQFADSSCTSCPMPVMESSDDIP